jgi:hypothetical protein
MRKHHRELGACMGAPGPHDFAVRECAARPSAHPASTAFRTAFVTTRTPLVPARNASIKAQLPKKRKLNIFAAGTGQSGSASRRSSEVICPSGGKRIQILINSRLRHFRCLPTSGGGPSLFVIGGSDAQR